MVYYDAFCMPSYGSASTVAYVDNTVSEVALTAAVDLYVYAGNNGAGMVYMDYWGTDVAISEEINTGRASADAQVSLTSGCCGWYVDTYHSFYAKIGSNSFSGDKTFEFGY